MTTQLNIRRDKAKLAAREIASILEIPISQAVEEVLLAAQGRLREHIKDGGSPDAFRAGLLIQRDAQRRD